MFRILTPLILLWPAWAFGASVFLNGVNIDGVMNQKFENCRVEIDSNGNVQIFAKGYVAKGGATEKPDARLGGPPTRKYFLVTEKAAPGMTQYDVDLFINAKWVRKLLDVEQHIVMDITKHLKSGPNKVRLIAKKKLGDGRRSSSPNHYFRIVVGEGESGGRNVMITKKAIDYKLTALQTQAKNDEFVLVAR